MHWNYKSIISHRNQFCKAERSTKSEIAYFVLIRPSGNVIDEAV